MKAKKNSECEGCGNPGVMQGITHVRYERGKIIQCELCHPELSEMDEADPDALYTIHVRIIGQRYAKPDGSYFIYMAELSGAQESQMPDGAKKPFGITGPIGQFDRGDIVIVTGRFVTNAKYGFQLDVIAQAQLAVKESELGLVAFLSKFPYIGRTRAQEIIRQLGTWHNVIEVLDKTPERLSQINGITPERAQDIKDAYDKVAGFREFRQFAAKLGLGESIIASAIDVWGEDAQKIIEADAFELLDLPRVSFRIADEVHSKLQRDPKQPSRCASAVNVALGLTCDEGHTYALFSELQGNARGRAADEIRRLGLSIAEIECGLALLEKPYTKRRNGQEMQMPPKVVRYKDRIYLSELWTAECSIATELKRLTSAHIEPTSIPIDAWAERNPAPEQEQALHFACTQPVIILTGGPGCGKTFTTNVILNTLETAGHRVVLCAPTGKAAKRMTELTGREASTIHRLLGLTKSKEQSNRLDVIDSIDGSVVVVDECSMVDTELMAKLLRGISTGTRLILVGDVDQLPSIGPGRVLHDLIESKLLPTIRLTRIFRQESDGSTKRIPDVARMINMGEMPDLTLKGTDVTFLPFDDPGLMQQKIVMAVTEQLPQKLGITTDQIQVIAPQRGEENKPNWPIGVRALNIVLQDALNPVGSEVHAGEGYKIRQGDRVIHTRNNYELSTMNGELGVVLRVDTRPFLPASEVVTSFRTKRNNAAKMCERCKSAATKLQVATELQTATELQIATELQACTCAKAQKNEKAAIVMVIDYGERQVGYTKDECREVQLAYALTCHKCQGSQSKVVVVPVHDVNQYMLTQSLIYTAITRAEQYVLLLGQETRFAKAIKNRRGIERRTSLQERLDKREQEV